MQLVESPKWQDAKDDSGQNLLACVERLESELRTVKARLTKQPRQRRHRLQTVTTVEIRRILVARRARESIFGDDLFADPAWDMLLELYAAELGQQRVATSELCIGAAVPATTALRWIEKLHDKGFVARRDDPLDGRRVWIELTEEGLSLMRRYFEGSGLEVCPLSGSIAVDARC